MLAAETPLISTCTLLVSSVPVLIAVPMSLNAAGQGAQSFTLSSSTPPAWLQLQFVGLDLGAPTGVFSLSNGLGLNVNN